MPWAAGSYTKGNDGTGGWTGDAGNGIGIEAGRHDTQDNDFTTGINSTLTKDGSNVPSANLPMGGFRHTGVGLATARDSYATLGQAQDGTAIWGGTSGGAANAQTLTLTPAITAYVTGQRFRFVAGFTNLAATTLNVNGVGPINIITQSTGVSLPSNYITSGAQYEVVYNGTAFVLLGDPALIKTGGYDYLGQSTGTANALVLTSTGPRLASTAPYKVFLFASNLTNTGAVTVAIDGLTAINVTSSPDGTALKAGQIILNRFYQLMLVNGSALLANPDTSWQSWTPTLTQGVGVTYTVTENQYKISGGNQITCVFGLTATSAGTPTNDIVITGLPISVAYSGNVVIGSALISSGSTIYTSVIVPSTTTSFRFFSGSGTLGNNVGTTPAVTLAVGSLVSGTAIYRI